MNIFQLCKKEFQSSYHLNRHKNKKIPCNIIEQYECKDCDKIFKYKSKLEEHNKTKNHLLIVNNITNNITNNNITNNFNNTNIVEDELKIKLQQEYEDKLNKELELKEE